MSILHFSSYTPYDWALNDIHMTETSLYNGSAHRVCQHNLDERKYKWNNLFTNYLEFVQAGVDLYNLSSLILTNRNIHKVLNHFSTSTFLERTGIHKYHNYS